MTNLIQWHSVELMKEFEFLSFFHVLRQHNSVVDHLANIGVCLDQGWLEVNGLKQFNLTPP